MKQPFLSIIVPVHNALPFLHACLESLSCQHFKDMEIILIDDGSDDGSSEVCLSYAKKQPMIKLLRQENQGALNARQSGVTAASGKYVGFVDADDWVEPMMYAHLCAAAQVHNAELVVCDYVKQTGSKAEVCGFNKPPGFYNADTYENKVLLNLFCTPQRTDFSPLCTQWNAIVEAGIARRELALLAGELRLGEDTAFMMGSALSSNRFVYLDMPLYHYRVHEGSVTHTAWHLRPEELTRQRAILYSFLKDRSEKRAICRILGQLESYMLFLVMFDLRSYFAAADQSLIARYLAAPWIADLLRCEQSSPQPSHWENALSELSAKL